VKSEREKGWTRKGGEGRKGSEEQGTEGKDGERSEAPNSHFWLRHCTGSQSFTVLDRRPWSPLNTLWPGVRAEIWIGRQASSRSACPCRKVDQPTNQATHHCVVASVTGGDAACHRVADCRATALRALVSSAAAAASSFNCVGYASLYTPTSSAHGVLRDSWKGIVTTRSKRAWRRDNYLLNAAWFWPMHLFCCRYSKDVKVLPVLWIRNWTPLLPWFVDVQRGRQRVSMSSPPEVVLSSPGARISVTSAASPGECGCSKPCAQRRHSESPEQPEAEMEIELAYPEYEPRALWLLNQTTRPRSWCLVLISWPYPFSAALHARVYCR